MPKQTLEERRRETLRRQLYGKEERVVVNPKRSVESGKTNSDSSKTYSLADHNVGVTSSSDTLTADYLTKDLTKVLTFSVLAIGIQLTLFFLLQNHILNLPI